MTKQFPDSVGCPFEDVKPIEGVQDVDVTVTINLDVDQVEAVVFRSSANQDGQGGGVQVGVYLIRIVLRIQGKDLNQGITLSLGAGPRGNASEEVLCGLPGIGIHNDPLLHQPLSGS